jgi:hypothetical protein
MGMPSAKERLLKRCCRLSASNNTEHEPAAIFDRDQDEKQDTAVVRVSGESVRVIVSAAPKYRATRHGRAEMCAVAAALPCAHAFLRHQECAHTLARLRELER